MTLIRRLAVKISDAVVHFASPGCKEWAEGLAGEIASIEGDWSALGWALGSTKVLLDRQEAPLSSLAEVPAAAYKLVDGKRTRASFALLFPILVFLYGFEFFDARTRQEQMGCAFAVLCSISLGAYLYVEGRRLDALMSGDIKDDLLLYKGELERNLHHSYQGLIHAFVFFYFVSLMLMKPGGIDAHWGVNALLGLGGAAVSTLIMHKRRIDRMRLQRLEALLVERAGAIGGDRTSG